MAEIALAWVMNRPLVCSIVLGARTVKQLDTNLRAAELPLDAHEITALDAASHRQPADYPYGDLGVQLQHRLLAGSS
jgi:aryl-alcohol dehydrogenase-like predicted oxidoreductase